MMSKLPHVGGEAGEDGAALDPGADLPDRSGLQPVFIRHRPDPGLDVVLVPPGEPRLRSVRYDLEPNALRRKMAVKTSNQHDIGQF